MNDNYLESFSSFSRISIGTFGAWPTQKNEKLSKCLFIISLFFLAFGVFIPQSIRVFQVWGDMDRLSNVLCVAELPYLVAFIKMIVLYRNKQKMSTLYSFMMDDWNRKKSNDELEIMIKSGDRGKRFSMVCIIMGHATAHSRMLQCIFENIPNWNSPGHFKNYTLYVDSYFPFTWNYYPAFELLCCFQYVGSVCATFSYSGTDSFFSQISFHYTAQYYILRMRLLHLINNFNNKNCESKFNEEFNRIINIHYYINSCIEIVESTFHLTFLVQILACTVQFCLLGYFFILYISQENRSSMLSEILFIIVFFMYINGNLYIYCYLAEMLQMESYAFAETAYDTEWFNLPSQKAKSLLLLMQRGNKPNEITAGKFVVFNFQLFGSIVKTSLGYLSFLITMKKNNK
ncbi:odorant receptor 4-like [Leptopilina boulardi]|uniref:odorant receptor 4-like n=1 Tax=Leptopilina boulardi TaxID=63433 RepID=UPI0021F53FBD|nr:odorant receptor 4-like [Leptopilina boulardi]